MIKASLWIILGIIMGWVFLSIILVCLPVYSTWKKEMFCVLKCGYKANPRRAKMRNIEDKIMLFFPKYIMFMSFVGMMGTLVYDLLLKRPFSLGIFAVTAIIYFVVNFIFALTVWEFVK